MPIGRINKIKLAILSTHPIQYFTPLYRRLAEEPDVDLTVYYCHEAGLKDYYDAGFGTVLKWDIPLLEGYRYKFLGNLATHTPFPFFKFVNPSIVFHLIYHQYDVIVIHGYGYFTFHVALLLCKILGTKAFLRTDANIIWLNQQRKGIRSRLRKLGLTLLFRFGYDAFLTAGQRNAEYYQAFGVDTSRLFLAPFSVDNRHFLEAEQYRQQSEVLKKGYGLPLELPVVLYVAKLTPHKRPMDVLRAHHCLAQKGIASILVFVGSGVEEQELRQYIASHSVPNVFLLGFRNQKELVKIYAVADIFVLPSEREAWGLVLNEAMSAGLPLIVSEAVGAATDLVLPNENGFVYPPGDVKQLADYLEVLIKKEDLRKRFGQRSRELIESWSLDHTVNGYKRAAKQVLQKRP